MSKDKSSRQVPADQGSNQVNHNQTRTAASQTRGMGGRGRGRGPYGHPVGPMVKPENLGKTLVRIGSYLKQDIPHLIMVVITILVNTACTLAGPLVIGSTIDRYIITGDFYGLVWASITLIAIYGVNSLSTYVQGSLMASISQKTVTRMRKDLFTKYQTLSLKFFDNHTHRDQ